MKIILNEREIEVEENISLSRLARLYKPEADIFIINGYPASPQTKLRERDSVVLIKKGEMPEREELEALMRARHTPGVARKLKKGKVGIAGLGGLGSAVAIALARVGVGTLVLVDFDVVEPSNLNRQHYFISQIGEYKTLALADTLKKINPFIKVVPHTVELTRENVVELFKDCDVIVEAFDKAEMKHMLIETVLEKMPEKYVVAASGLAGYGHSNEIKTRRFGKLFMCGDGKREAKPGQGLMAPRVGIAAHMQANTVMEILVDFLNGEKEVLQK